MDILDLINYGFLISGLTIALIGIFFSFATRVFNSWFPNYFVILFLIIFIYLSFTLVTSLTLGTKDPSLTEISRISMFIDSVASSLLMPMLSILIVKTTNENENWRNSHFMRTISALWLIYIALLIFTQFTDYIYYFTPDNTYHRGDYYPLLLLPPALLMGSNIIAIIHRWKLLTRSERIAFTADIVLPLIGIIVQMLFYGILTIALGSVIAALCLFVFLMEESIKQSLQQININADQKASILSLQMRPHFIYNALTSIYYLCDDDPQKAKKTVLDFSTYLRKNFTAISNDETVPFDSELEHVKAYLAVEQTRFPNKISVNYETEFTDFKLPPLTLQPLVENSVKHGINNDSGHLTITICTINLSDSIKIVVEDDGVGYKKIRNDDPHIALDNIRQRLKTYCNGTMSIASDSVSSGTTVTITIPKSFS